MANRKSERAKAITKAHARRKRRLDQARENFDRRRWKIDRDHHLDLVEANKLPDAITYSRHDAGDRRRGFRFSPPPPTTKEKHGGH